MNIYLVAVVIYLVFMALIGVYFAKKSVKNSDDFMVAGRSLPLFVVMGTLLATFVGWNCCGRSELYLPIRTVCRYI